jgi:hypothetical protein
MSIDSLKTLLARRRLVWFFALTLAPAALSHLGGISFFSLSLSFYLYTAGPIAALLCWAGDAEPRRERQPRRRFLAFLAVTIGVTPVIGYLDEAQPDYVQCCHHGRGHCAGTRGRPPTEGARLLPQGWRDEQPHAIPRFAGVSAHRVRGT